jgi:dephospho-CoA kinase
MPIKAGITGGIGSGKSVVCEIFRRLGTPVFHADDEAKKLYTSDNEIKASIINQFGKKITTHNGVIDNKALASVIFNDENALKLINSIVHPVVDKMYNAWLLKFRNEKLTLIEAALLFESGFYKKLDLTVTVVAPDDLKIIRVVRRDKITPGEVMARMNHQYNDEQRRELSDYLIFNDEKQLLIPQVLKIYNKLITV